MKTLTVTKDKDRTRILVDGQEMTDVIEYHLHQGNDGPPTIVLKVNVLGEIEIDC